MCKHVLPAGDPAPHPIQIPLWPGTHPTCLHGQGEPARLHPPARHTGSSSSRCDLHRALSEGSAAPRPRSGFYSPFSPACLNLPPGCSIR